MAHDSAFLSRRSLSWLLAGTSFAALDPAFAAPGDLARTAGAKAATVRLTAKVPPRLLSYAPGAVNFVTAHYAFATLQKLHDIAVGRRLTTPVLTLTGAIPAATARRAYFRTLHGIYAVLMCCNSDLRRKVCRSLYAYVGQTNNLSGLRGLHLTLLNAMRVDGQNALYRTGLQQWNTPGDPIDAGLGQLSTYNFGNGALVSIGGEGELGPGAQQAANLVGKYFGQGAGAATGGALSGAEQSVHDTTEKYLGKGVADAVTNLVDKGIRLGSDAADKSGVIDIIGFVVSVVTAVVEVVEAVLGSNDKPAPQPAPDPSGGNGGGGQGGGQGGGGSGGGSGDNGGGGSGNGSGDNGSGASGNGGGNGGNGSGGSGNGGSPSGGGTKSDAGDDDGLDGPYLPIADTGVGFNGVTGPVDISALRLKVRWVGVPGDGGLFDPSQPGGAHPNARSLPIGGGYALRRTASREGPILTRASDEEGMGGDSGWTPIPPIVGAANLIEPSDSQNVEELDPNGRPVSPHAAPTSGAFSPSFRPRPIGIKRVGPGAFVMVMRS